MFFFFFITNALFVTIVYVLTQVNAQQSTLSIPLPCNVGKNQGKIEPISIAFTLVFGILLFIQFFGMLMHRISTISHIMASTKIFGRNLSNKVPMKITEKPKTIENLESEKPEARTMNFTQSISLKSGLSLRELSAKNRKTKNRQTLRDLRSKIKNVKTIEESPEGNEDLNKILSRYSNKPVPRTSIINPMGRTDLETETNGSLAGPSSA